MTESACKSEKTGSYFKPGPRRDASITISTTAEVKDFIDAMCVKERKSRSQYITEVLKNHMAGIKAEPPAPKYFARSYFVWEMETEGLWESYESDAFIYFESFNSLEDARTAYLRLAEYETIGRPDESEVRGRSIRNVRFVRECGTFDDENAVDIDVMIRETVMQP